MSLEINKMAAAVLTAGVVAMSAGFVANLLVHPTQLAENAYPIQVADGPTAAPVAEEPRLEPVLPLLADADLAAGEAAFRPCAACHTYEEGGAQRVGPNLWDIVGASHAHIDGFNYSSAMQDLSGEPWTYEALNAFLANPRQAIPGTRMAYGGMRNVQDRANLIAWLRSLSDDPEPLPSEEEIQAVSEEAAAEEGEVEGEAAEEASVEEGEGQAAEAEAEAEAEEPGSEAAGEEAAAAEGNEELLAMIADADPAAGENLSRRCAACHTFDEGGPNRVGPNLWDVLGKPVAHLEGFNFSGAAQELHDEGVTWSYDNVDAFLENPRGWMPGTRMVFPGLRSPEDRAALIAFMRTKSENPPPLD